MSDARSLSVEHGLRLLEQINETFASFSNEAVELRRSERERRWKLQREEKQNSEHSESRLASEIQTAESEHQAERTRIESIHENRRARIDQLSREANRTLARRAQEARERWVGELQMREFLTDRRLQSERDAADSDLAARNSGLHESAERLRRLESRARNYFTGYLGYVWRMHRSGAGSEASGVAIDSSLDHVEGRLAEFRRLVIPKIFSFAPVPAILAALGVAIFVVARRNEAVDTTVAAILAVIVAAAVLIVHAIGKKQSRALADDIISGISATRAEIRRGGKMARDQRTNVEKGIAAQKKVVDDEIARKWERSEEVRAEFETRESARLKRVTPRARERNDRLRDLRLSRLEKVHADRMEKIRENHSRQSGSDTSRFSTESSTMDETIQHEHADLERRWRDAIEPLFAEVAAMNALAGEVFPPWSRDFVDSWAPAHQFTPAAKFANLEVDVPTAAPDLPVSVSPGISIPLALSFPDLGSILFESKTSLGKTVAECLNQIILRLLATTPPGKVSFTILDPVGLGKNFAGLMHLADFEEHIITRRIWTQADQIEDRLGEISQHIEKVIQMYLRDEFSTILEYNERAGSTAEKHQFLVIADFPANFSETAIKRLQSILSSGPRCGVHTLIHWDRRQPLPPGIDEKEMRANSVCIQAGENGLTLEDPRARENARLILDEAPPPERAQAFIEQVGERSIDSNQVQVPFDQIAPAAGDLWKSETTTELRVAIGRAGAAKQQMLAIGKGTRQHALVAGKTGSGKSTLFHVLITNLALSCSPEQVEFYLIDFKKGVEFKCYATKRLPHARVVAIESDREFGLSVLHRVDDELRRRGDQFRKLGVQDLAAYKRESENPMPRTLLLIDEFQELFVEDDSVAQNASVLLDRIVRQGRAFGIHVILGSQTLGGAYSLARTTLGQMVIRIALQCNEADAYLIMDDNNPAPRLLSRPGEGIYNDSAGAIEGNSPFQVCWLPDDERDRRLDDIRALVTKHPDLDCGPIVFEGNAPADIAENELLARILDASPDRRPATPRAWLGAPNSIKGPTEIQLPRQGGANLLVVGQRDEASLAMLGISTIALAAQYPKGSAQFILLHQNPDDTAESDFIRGIEGTVDQQFVAAGAIDAPRILGELAAELQQRLDGDANGPDIFLLVHGLHRFRKLRAEDDFDFSYDSDAAPKPSAQFAELLVEGASVGIHVLTSIDTFSSVNRFFNRKALAEFGLRVLFQMSTNDSASLIDSPKAGDLGLHRALLFDEHAGTLETFRPYAMPSGTWLSSHVRAERRSPENALPGR